MNSVEEVLEAHIPPAQLAEVKRILYGRPAIPLDVTFKCKEVAAEDGYELAAWRIGASKEETRPARKVTIALIQNSIVLPTNAPILNQVKALHKRIGAIIENAARAGANIVCLQEAWTMPWAQSTREKHPWTQFAESAETGASTAFLADLAAKHRMVIISPIVERVRHTLEK